LFSKPKAVVVPKAVVAHLGKGDLEFGTKLLDGFFGHDGTPIDWPEGEPYDYI
jgi:hypothetical protein